MTKLHTTLWNLLRQRRSVTVIPSREALDRAHIGGGDYVAVGNEFLDYFRDLGSLARTDRVLEVGCGLGRMARPLSQWLEPPGAYCGFDVARDSIAWCRKHIPSSGAPTEFKWVDAANSLYNPAGRIQSDAVTFPYRDATFDFVIAVSVFTHLLPPAAARYMSEIRRVLRPGGRSFVTWFIWPQQDPSAEATALFPFAREGHRVNSTQIPEAAVAYSSESISSLYAGTILRTVEGHWRAGQHAAPYQDLVVARR